MPANASSARGRDHEITVVTELIARAATGRGGVVVIDGPPGIGKSRLIAEALALAAESGMRTLGAKAHESQHTVPFAPLLDVALSGDQPLGDATALRQTSSQTDLHYWVVYDFQAMLEEAAAKTPLVVWLDDLQWADAGTLLALRSLTGNLSDVSVLWLLALRTGESRRQVRELIERLQSDGATRLSLEPLAPGAVSAIVADVTGARPDPQLSKIVEEAEGNPFLLLEVLHGLSEEDRLFVDDARTAVRGERLPLRLTSSMRDRLEAMGEETHQLMLLAAVLPRRFSALQLATTLKRQPSSIAPAIEVAMATELLVGDGTQLGFRHDLVREAVRESIPTALRRALEREAAQVLLAGGAAPAEVAVLLMASAEFGDLQAVATLRAAARVIAPSDANIGADLSRRALDLLPLDDAERGHVVGETVILLNLAGRSADAQMLADEALTIMLDSEQEAAVRLSLSRMITRPAFERAAANVRALSLPNLSPQSRAAHIAWLSYNKMMSGEALAARVAATHGLQIPEIIANPELRILCHLTLATVDCCDGQGRRSAAGLEELLAMRANVRGSQLGAVEIQHPNLLVVLGQVERGHQVVLATVARAQRERNGAVLTILTQVVGLINVAAGRLADARAEADSIDGLLDDVRAGNLAGWIRMLVTSQLAQHTGDPRLAKGAADAAERLIADESPMVRRWAARVLAVDAMQRGDAVSAASWLADDPLTTITPPVPNELDFLLVAAHAAVVTADPDLRDRVRAASDRLSSELSGIPLFHAVANHLRGILDGDAANLVMAAEQLATIERPLLRAAAQEDAGRQLLADGRRDEAIRWLNASARGYEACDAAASADRVYTLLPRQRGDESRPSRPTHGFASLTESELAVVRIVARGATNRDVATQLFVSPHTVSSHLRSAFQKLGVNSRVQLTNAVRAAGL